MLHYIDVTLEGFLTDQLLKRITV